MARLKRAMLSRDAIEVALPLLLLDDRLVARVERHETAVGAEQPLGCRQEHRALAAEVAALQDGERCRQCAHRLLERVEEDALVLERHLPREARPLQRAAQLLDEPVDVAELHLRARCAELRRLRGNVEDRLCVEVG
eukprot:1593255-Prymnesium_polylepis.1